MSDPKHPVSIDELNAQAHAGPGLLTIVWRRKTLVLLGKALGVVLGVLYFFQQTPKFQSSADLVVWKRRADPLPMGGQDSRVAVIEDFVATQSSLMRSHEVLLKAASILEKNRAEMRDMPQVPLESLVGYIQSGLTITRPKDPAAATNAPSNILNVAWRGNIPEDCPKIVDAVIAGYRSSLGVEVDAALDGEIRSAKLSIEQTKKTIADAEADLKRVLTQIQQRSSVSLNEIKTRIGLFEAKQIELKEKQIELDSRLKQIQRGIAEKKDPRLLLVLFQLTASKNGEANRPAPEVRQNDDALFNLRLQEEELMQNFGPDHPQVKALRKRMASIKEYMEKNNVGQQAQGEVASPEQLIQLFVQVLEEDRKKLDETQQNIRSNLASDHETVRSMDSLVIQEQDLRTTISREKLRLGELTNSLNTKQLRQDAPLFDARVINPAGLGYKVAPVMASSISFGYILGTLVGLALAFLAEVSDQSFRSPEEIRRRLGVSVIGHIPPLIPHEATDEAQKRLDPMLVVHHRPKSIEAESFRGLRTSLYFSTVGKGHQLIQVTSPHPGDGKSTLTANLAAVIAQSGKRVILIDCDFRKPRVHKIFGLESSEVGVTSVLLGECDLSHAIQTCGVPGLDLLPCGPRPTNPAELLSSQQYREFLERIRTMYDFVLIDTPPLLAVSDPAAVATQVDGVLLCTKLSKTARPAAERAKEVLTTMGANLVGILVNDSEAVARSHDSYGTTGYNYGSQYNYQYSEDYTDDDEPSESSSPRKSR